MELYSKVRMAVLRDGLSGREAARRFGINRGTVAKMVGHSVPPGYRQGQPRVRPKLDAHASFIDEILKSDLAEPKKQRHTILRLFERLRDERGFDGGYWCFKPPTGYRYERVSGHGKLLVRDEPVATMVQEALEGYAAGRFSSPAEVKRYLDAQPEYPKDLPNGEIRMQRISELLSRPIYAGYIEVKKWDIGLRKGHHEGLISLATWEKIQERRGARAVAPFRKDIAEDFPLRGFVCCADCDKPMTSCWSKLSRKHYAYYFCDTRDCESYRKSIPRAKIEDGFEDILKTMQPTQSPTDVASAMFRDLWDQRLANSMSSEKALKSELVEAAKQSDTLLERIVDTTSLPVITAYEKKIEALERRKLVLSEKLADLKPATGRFDQMFDLT